MDMSYTFGLSCLKTYRERKQVAELEVFILTLTELLSENFVTNDHIFLFEKPLKYICGQISRKH